MANSFEIEFDFVEKWGRFAKPEYFRIYIYILSKYKKDKTTYTSQELAEILDIKETKVRGALEYWAMEGLLALSQGGYTFLEDAPQNPKEMIKAKVSTRPSYTHTEIDRATAKNKEISYLFSQTEKILGKLLSSYDMETLYSFVDWLGLPVEVVIMIINYASSNGKGTMRYIERVAMDWSDREINTYEKAEEYIKELEEYQTKARKICRILGIYDRALSVTEKKYIKVWTEEKDIPLDLIPIAYDKTMIQTGKMSWSYMNKILCAWFDAGVKTQDDLEKYEAKHKEEQGGATAKQTPKKSNKFSNYKDTNEIDYKKHAEQVLLDMLDE